MTVTIKRGFIASFRRPRVSNDSPFSEARARGDPLVHGGNSGGLWPGASLTPGPLQRRVPALCPGPEDPMTDARLQEIALPGTPFAVRVTPRASREKVEVAEGVVRVYVTCVPEDGKANRAVTEALARALGVAKSRLSLVRGATSRDKTFRLD